MLAYPNIDPVAIAIGPFKVHWYGLMYVIGFLAAWWLGTRRAERIGLKRDDVGDLLFYAAIGVVGGGRLGYALFYGLEQWLTDPLWIFKVWDGGMSFHGGLIGVLVASLLFARRKGLAFFTLTDFVAPLVPVGLGAGRIGNFINHELMGRTTDLPWGMVFPGTDGQPRHPSALYEAVLEGLVLFLILWFVSATPRRRGLVSGLFLVCYGAFRFSVEFVRQPDPQLGFIALGWVTMGMLLSLPMIVAGIVLILWSRSKPVDAKIA
ncbi:prolipoprotein diacylglyceryl transferase [Halomonas binhaiensis]|uniref:Phosphatidylglycerol--prolipoprotein diacylglyceryl transferase n=1 Tax=Halomonas binhaiensis TaxID=2562282 RepID=A0A5C1NFA1_9GAMM|nr:prolipoprotein diacylglyceryl transferase [Halomonas binhaiensis]QEM80877.1 prolipoprotein diacylglyceryl transferase [Halomonas binhaiensis]